MNPLVKKEIRLLLPAWITAMLLATVPVWFFGSLRLNSYTSFTWVPDSCFAFGVILLGIASFGQEFSSGTFPMLLSQPIERRRLWFVKTFVLVGIFISVLLASLISRKVQLDLCDFTYYQRPPLARLAPVMSWSNSGLLVLYAAACFGGGLWTTLLLRRMAEAFWVTLLVPPAITVVVGALLGEFIASSKILDLATSMVLLLTPLLDFSGRADYLFVLKMWNGQVAKLRFRRAKESGNQQWFHPIHATGFPRWSGRRCNCIR